MSFLTSKISPIGPRDQGSFATNTHPYSLPERDRFRHSFFMGKGDSIKMVLD